MAGAPVIIPPALMKSLDEMRCVFLIGAGASVGEGLPSVSDLIDILHDQLKIYVKDIAVLEEAQKLKGNNDLAGMATVYENQFSSSDARLIISQAISEAKEKIKPVFHEKLGQIPSIKHIVTTNWDSLIEDSLPKPGVVVIREVGDLRDYRPMATNVYKIHGCITQRDRMVLDLIDYAKFTKIRAGISEEVKSLLRKSVI